MIIVIAEVTHNVTVIVNFISSSGAEIDELNEQILQKKKYLIPRTNVYP